MVRILIVEDDPAWAEPLQLLLRRDGFATVLTGGGPTAVTEPHTIGADLVLLDMDLQGVAGTEVCTRIRATSNVPIIMVTARDTELDRVLGLELGADDYVTKPYSDRELIARIRAVLRRCTPPEPDNNSRVLTAGPLTMNVDAHRVHLGERELRLPLKEFQILENLMRNAGRVLTRDQLIEWVWGASYHEDSKSLNAHIKRLRTKIETNHRDPQLLITIRGRGYMLKT